MVNALVINTPGLRPDLRLLEEFELRLNVKRIWKARKFLYWMDVCLAVLIWCCVCVCDELLFGMPMKRR